MEVVAAGMRKVPVLVIARAITEEDEEAKQLAKSLTMTLRDGMRDLPRRESSFEELHERDSFHTRPFVMTLTFKKEVEVGQRITDVNGIGGIGNASNARIEPVDGTNTAYGTFTANLPVKLEFMEVNVQGAHGVLTVDDA